MKFSECKRIDIDEEDKIDIVLLPFPSYCFVTFSLSYEFLTESLFLAFPVSSFVQLMCLLAAIGIFSRFVLFWTVRLTGQNFIQFVALNLAAQL